MKRRALLTSALAVAACSGDSSVKLPITLTSIPPPVPTPAPAPSPSPPPPAPPPAASWAPGPINFTLGATFDLMTTLPISIRRGGVFSVSSTGAALPPTIRLTPDGLLTATANATVSGVVFSYSEP